MLVIILTILVMTYILQSIKEHKDLGVIMDLNLKFHVHTSAVANKANQVLGLIRISFTNLNGHTLPLLYKSLVRPHLEYVNVVKYHRVRAKTSYKIYSGCLQLTLS